MELADQLDLADREATAESLLHEGIPAILRLVTEAKVLRVHATPVAHATM
jgi:hypothetical protein